MIQEGDLIFLYLFDIGGEVKLEGLELKLEEYGKARLEKLQGASWIEDGIRLETKDVVEVLGEKANIQVKIFSIGGVLVKTTLSFKDKDFNQILDLLSRAEGEAVKDGLLIDMAEFAKDLANRIKETIGPFIVSQYGAVDYFESYRVILVRKGDRNLIEKDLKSIASLVRRESSSDRLSSEEVQEILSNRYSYRENFFIADIKGAFAFVINTEQTFPVLRAVELFLLQKLELRVYDTLLDEMLEKSYDILAKAKSKSNRELDERMNEVHLLRLELLEVVSAMKSLRGSVRARIFRSLGETLGEVFEVQDLADSVTRKLDRLGEIYTIVYDSLQSARFIRMDRTMVMLEAIIVILIAVEIVLALAGK
jgi:hypothetical protein